MDYKKGTIVLLLSALVVGVAPLVQAEGDIFFVRGVRGNADIIMVFGKQHKTLPNNKVRSPHLGRRLLSDHGARYIRHQRCANAVMVAVPQDRSKNFRTALKARGYHPEILTRSAFLAYAAAGRSIFLKGLRLGIAR